MSSLENFQFAAEVYKQLLTTNPGSFAFCPLSVELVLALIHAGAHGETARQLSTGLHLPESSEEIQRIFKNVTSEFKSNSTLNCVNKIYVKEGCEIKEEFKSIADRIFNVQIENIDFGKEEEAVAEMNKWVEEKTQDKIKNLISSKDIDNSTSTILINAIYFCGKWEKVFSRYLTSKSPFYLNNKDKVEIDMMTQKDYFGFYDSAELDATFLELPYEDEDVTINFVLPKDKEGLSKLESRIFDVLTAPQYSTYDVLVLIPKFETDTTIEFKPTLQTMGIIDAFEDSGDFSGVVESQTTKISAVIQKAVIEVQEEGTTAAATTDSWRDLSEDCFVLEMMPPPPSVEFIADHPFLFYFKFKDVVLFVGRFSSVTK